MCTCLFVCPSARPLVCLSGCLFYRNGRTGEHALVTQLVIAKFEHSTNAHTHAHIFHSFHAMKPSLYYKQKLMSDYKFQRFPNSDFQKPRCALHEIFSDPRSRCHVKGQPHPVKGERAKSKFARHR